MDLRAAVEQADVAAAPDSAILILGTTAYWHDHLWATLWTDRLLFYDDWLWYWQREHAGAYDPDTEHAYTSDASTIDTGYLATHGIGAIVVTGQAKAGSRRLHFSNRSARGIYDVYLVTSPTTLATLDGRNSPARSDDETIYRDRRRGGRHRHRAGELVPTLARDGRWPQQSDCAPERRLHGHYGACRQHPARDQLRRAGFDWLADAIALIAALVCLALLSDLDPLLGGDLDQRRQIPRQGQGDLAGQRGRVTNPHAGNPVCAANFRKSGFPTRSTALYLALRLKCRASLTAE